MAKCEKCEKMLKNMRECWKMLDFEIFAKNVEMLTQILKIFNVNTTSYITTVQNNYYLHKCWNPFIFISTDEKWLSQFFKPWRGYV